MSDNWKIIISIIDFYKNFIYDTNVLRAFFVVDIFN